MRFIKTKEDSLEENYLELHYDKIDDDKVNIAYFGKLNHHSISTIVGTFVVFTVN